MTQEEKRLATRKRLHDDFQFYSKNCLKIRTKAGEIKPLELNAAQQILQESIDRQMATTGMVRCVILKARQQGLSTHVGGWLTFKTTQNKARKAMVLTHHAESTKALFDMTKRYYANLPVLVKPHSKYSSRKELTFDLLDSGYTVATAGGEAIGRGETLNYVHASEVAFWQKSTAKENWNGLTQAVPNTKDTAIFAESTANGVSGIFYDLWKGAVDGTNGYDAVFIPWFIDVTYRRPVTRELEHTPDELDLINKYDLDDEQLMFRRQKIAENGIDMFKQEYPATADEAFLTSGRPVFNPEQLMENLETALDPIGRMSLEGDAFEANSRGELTLYRTIDPGESYYIGADVALGVRGGDWSVAQVLDSKKRQVASFRAIVHPDYFASTLYHMGMLFNTARIIVESNNHGILTCTRLGKDMAYPNFYVDEVYDQTSDKFTERLGFATTVKTKPLIIDKLRAEMREGTVELNDKTTIREMLTYIVTESGNMEAEQGCHDDTVVSLALVNHIHEGRFEPVNNLHSFYIEMV